MKYTSILSGSALCALVMAGGCAESTRRSSADRSSEDPAEQNGGAGGGRTPASSGGAGGRLPSGPDAAAGMSFRDAASDPAEDLPGPSDRDDGPPTAVEDAGTAAPSPERPRGSLRFRHQVLRTAAISEGASFGDINRDGMMDIVAGAHWFEGPAFTAMRDLYPAPMEVANPLQGASNSRDWVTHVFDFDGDGWPDVLRGRAPYQSPSFIWYRNPGTPMLAAERSSWAATNIGPGCVEQRPFIDLNADGKPDIVAVQGSRLGFYDSKTNWTSFATIDPNAPFPNDCTTHGLGYGDIDSDGKMDVLQARGWYRQTEGGWVRNAYNFQPPGLVPYTDFGGADMFGYDVDGDGDTDVVSSLDAHGWGLAWFEQKKTGDRIDFVPHLIMGTDKDKDRFGGIAYSQLHSLYVLDMDNDGLTDIVSGKSFKVHPQGDPDVNGTPFIYVWKLVRSAGAAKFVPHKVAEVIGVGRQFTAGDVNGDGLPDIVTSTRQGAHVFLQEPQP